MCCKDFSKKEQKLVISRHIIIKTVLIGKASFEIKI